MNFRKLLGLPQQRRLQRRERSFVHSRWAGLERLECRTLLAGDVSAAIQGQNAFISGDAANNSIELAVENGNVVVRGLNGTTVNGSKDTFVLVADAGSISGSLRVGLGNGNDTFNVNGVNIVNDLVINGGNGNDRIGVSNSSAIGRNLVIDGWRGHDTITLQNSTFARDAVLRGSHGNDMLAVSSATIGRHLSISGGAGNDDIVVDGSTIGQDATLTGWGGNDDIVVRNSTISDDLTVVGHSGHDIVMIDTSTVGDRSRIAGRSGNDNVVIQGASQLQGRSIVLGGGGADNFSAAAEATIANLRSWSFSGSTADAAVAQRITAPTAGAIAAADAALAVFDQQISLLLSTTSVAENAGAGAATLTVSLSTPADQAVSVTLTSSNTSRLTTQQTTLTIAAGSTSGTVLLDPQNNSATDGDAAVSITATAADFNTATVVINVTDDETITVPTSATLTGSASQVTEDTGNVDSIGNANTINFQLALSTAPTIDETYTLNYALEGGGNASGFVSGPSSVTVAANQKTADFLISTVPNDAVDTDQTVTVTALLNGVPVASDTYTIIDNDSARLTVTLDQSSVTEDGPPATVTVTRNSDTTGDLPITLTVSNSLRVSIAGQASRTITIPAGSSSVTQVLTTVDDAIDNGDDNVMVTAAVPGHTQGTAILGVIDNDNPQLSITLPGTNIVAENAGANALTATVSRNSGDLSSALIVMLVSSGDARLTVPASVIIPAGQSSVNVALGTVNNAVVDNPPTGTAIVTASSTGLADGVATISITEDDSATFTISPASIVVSEADGTGTLTLTRNSSVVAQDVSLSFSNTDLITGPSTVSFDAGANIRTVQFTILDNQSFDDNPNVTLTATSGDNPAVTAGITIINDDVLTLTTDFTSNNAIETVGALVTKENTFVITGTTSPGATVQVDTNGDLTFDEGEVFADANGDYAIAVPLIHDAANDGLNRVQVRALLPNEGIITTSAATDVHLAIGTLVRFETNQDLDSNGTNDFYDVELFDADALATVDNFLTYVTDGSYDNMIIHRSPPGFVIQGGGFAVADTAVSRIATRAAIDGEFSSVNPNLRGTLSMAHTGDPNTGTSQWFVNVRDNNVSTSTFTSLDEAGHTVFGRIIASGMTVVDRINSISTVDLSFALGLGLPDTGPLSQTPIVSSPFTTLSGTVALTANSSTLIGTNTAFSTEVQVGDVLDVFGVQVKVTGIVSDTEITIDVEASGNQAGLAVSLISPPPDAAYLVFTNIGEILDSI